MSSSKLFILVGAAALLVGEVATDIGGPPPFPGGVTPKVPENVESGINRVRNSFFAQCREQGVRDPEALVEDVGNSAQRCIEDNLNMTEIQEDIAQHMKNGDLDKLFSGRCRTLPPIIYSCAEIQLAKLSTCLNETERAKDYPGHMMNGLRAAIDFLCFQDGERIAIFLGDKGQECVSANATRDSVQGCLKSHNLTEHVSEQFGSLTYGFTPDNCDRLFVAHDCVVDGLRLCEDSTPSNVVDSLLLAFEKPLPCKRATAGVGQPPLADWAVLLLSWAVALLLGRLR
ncbi:27 kDa hemolymph glycoprotein-like isoform X2 [Amphibalanus amphitrite]|nr:27 kDa hemolymph glycoprotein-like isoform X2 [Amphibalanus amphitrite]